MAVQEPMESPKIPEFRSITKEFLLGNDIVQASNDYTFQSSFPQLSNTSQSAGSKLLRELDEATPSSFTQEIESLRSSFLSGSLCHLYNGARNKAPTDFPILSADAENFDERQSSDLPLTVSNCEEDDEGKPPVAPISRKSFADPSGARKRKRPTSKREPLASEYSDDQEYQQAWLKWREDRDNNNVSVKQSRQRAKLKKLGALKAVSDCNKPTGSDEDEETHSLKQDLRLLVMKCKGRKLSTVQSKRAALLLQLYDEKDSPKSTNVSRVRKWKTGSEKKTRKSASPPAITASAPKTIMTRTGRLSKSRTR